ncbi:Clp protease [Hyphomicrobium methylovorum]|nr:Clp protease [Hyphomicrobium methylovorum]
MAYRGEDLDLRTSQTFTAAAGEFAATDVSQQNGKRSGYRTDPILVDDIVLACCNQAYDVAVAHRAGEVRVEHLLNAMTRLDAAATVLEARGIRIPSLRRETGTIIASEIPAVGGNEPVSPRRSEELAELLRQAAYAASRRKTAVSVDDLVQALFDHRGALPASEILLHYTARAPLREAPEPLPPLTRAGDGRYPQAPGVRYLSDGQRSYRSDYSGTTTDALQNSRIEALEQMVRALGQDLSNERHIISGLVRDLTRETRAQQEDGGHRQSVLLDRIGTLEEAVLESRGAPGSDKALVGKLEDVEAALELRLQEMTQSWSVLSQRLQELEIAVRERREPDAGPSVEDIRSAVDLRPLLDRLAIIEEAVLTNSGGTHAALGAELGERFDKLRSDISNVLAVPADPTADASLAAGLERIGSLSERIDEQHGFVSQVSADLSERLGAVERAVTGEIETSAAKHQAYTNDLTEVHDALMKLNQNQHTLAGSMDQWRTDSATDVANIINRIASLDQGNAIPAETINSLNAHMDNMNRFIIERYRRRHGFWYWLFGTDDWLGASWPSKSRETKDATEGGSASA